LTATLGSRTSRRHCRQASRLTCARIWLAAHKLFWHISELKIWGYPFALALSLSLFPPSLSLSLFLIPSHLKKLG
jgi:hypothetical protein